MCDFISGWFGGCCGLLLGHPFDTLKVRQQAFGYSSILLTTKDCLKQDGMKTFFRGLSYPLFSTGAINSLFFGVYGTALSKLEPTDGKPSYRNIFLAGCIGGAGQLVLAVPVDVIKVKLQVSSGETYKGPFDCLKKIYQAEGIKGTGLIDMPRKEDNTALEMFTAGGLAGLFSWQAIIYLDVIKSRIQADDASKPKYRGMLDCARKLYGENGIRVFGRGFILMSLRAFPLNGATFLGYEYCMKFCNNRNL